jgi:hypothetical protein
MAAKTHELKIDQENYQAILEGLKTYELRKNDRCFSVGDFLLLKETEYTGEEMANGNPLEYTGRQHEVQVIHILSGPIYGLEAGWVIMSICDC